MTKPSRRWRPNWDRIAVLVFLAGTWALIGYGCAYFFGGLK